MANAPLPDGPNLSRPAAIQPNTTAPRPPGPTEAGGAAFRALLESLQEKARQLEATSRSVDDPTMLAGAVDTARSSLEDALSLGDQLLEAYREARHQTDSPETGAEGSGGA